MLHRRPEEMSPGSEDGHHFGGNRLLRPTRRRMAHPGTGSDDR